MDNSQGKAMKNIVLFFSGWVECSPEKVEFRNLETGDIISGDAYVEMSEEQRENYILEDAVDVMRDSEDGEFEQLDVHIEDDDSDDDS